MPHYYNNTLVVTAEELVPKFYKTIAYLSVKLSRHEKKGYGLRRARTAGGKNQTLLIEFDSLQPWIRDSIGDTRILDNSLETYYVENAEAYRYYSNANGNTVAESIESGFIYPDGSHLKPHTISQLTINASVMLAAVKLYEARKTDWISKNKALRSLLSSVHDDVVKFNAVLNKTDEEGNQGAGHKLPTTYPRFKESFEAFATATVPFYTLISDAEGKTKLNAQKCDEAHQELLNNMFAKSEGKPHFAKVHEQYKSFRAGDLEITNQITGKEYQPSDFEDLGKSTIKYALNKYSNKLGNLAQRSGDNQRLQTATIPYYSFERPKLAGSLISIDDRNPPFWYDKNRSRMWFYIGLDVASGAITCFVHGKDKKSLIVDFYRQMVRMYAAMDWRLPHELEAELSLNSTYKETLLKPGAMFQATHIIPNNARAKRIEREFGKLRYEIEKEREGWIARPFAKSEHNQSGSDKTKIIPYPQLAMQCIMDIKKLNELPHPTMPELTRWEYAQKFQNPDLKETNYKEILKHIGFTQKSSCKVGRVELKSKKWLIADNGAICTGEALLQKMELIEGQRLNDNQYTLRYLDDVHGNVLKAMIFEQGRYVCELIEEPKPQKATVERTDKDVELLAIHAAYQKTILTFQKLRKNTLKPVLIEDISKEEKKNTFDLSVFGFNTEKYEQQDNSEVQTVSKTALDEEYGDDKYEGSYADRHYSDELTV
jgi:hypothetical protein